MLHVRLHHLADEVLRAANHAAQGAALPVNMLGGGIDHHIRAQINGAAEDRGGEHIVHHHQGPRRMGDLGHGLDIHQFQRRVRHALEEHRLGHAGPHRCPPLIQVGALDKGHLNAIAAQDFLQDIEARAKQRPGRHHMIPRPQHRHQGTIHRRHAAGGGKGIFGAFQRRDAFLEHPGRGVAITGIDEFIALGLDEARLRRLGGRIDKALGQKDRLGHLAILAAAAAFMHQRGARLPILAHLRLRPIRP